MSKTPAQPQKTNKRVSRFPPSTSVKKLKFSGGLLHDEEKENIIPQFSLSLPVTYDPKSPATPAKDLTFSDSSYNTPKTPETPSSTPSTPPTPRVIHSDDEGTPSQNNEDLDWLIKSDTLRTSDADNFLHSNISNFNSRVAFESTESFTMNSGSFATDLSASGCYVSNNSTNNNNNNINMASVGSSGSYVNNNNNITTSAGITFGASGSFINQATGSFATNNNATTSATPVAHMPPPRPVKKTPANTHANQNVPHSAGYNPNAPKPAGFAPLLRRRSSSLTSLINPFTPEGRAIKEAKEAHNPSYRKMLEEATLPKNWNAHTIQALIRQPPASGSIYRLLFEELEVIGRGTFGEVTKCRQKIDGCVYAIKRTIRQLRGKKDRMLVLREVYGLAAIQQHDHIVRYPSIFVALCYQSLILNKYFTAWEEDNRIFIQMELCEGGTLQSWVDSRVEATEIQLLTVLRHIALGLCYVHSQGLVHLDIKPENIYIKYSVPGEPTSEPIFKIGDLGLLNEADNSKIYMEGDSRYLSRELLQDDMTCLRKSDIFALGATIYELARRKPLPRNGQEWTDIRDGVLNFPSTFSPEFCELVRLLISPLPGSRPTAEDIVRHPLVMLVAKIPSVKVEGLEGCTCGRGQEALEILKSQVDFYRAQIHKLQSAIPNNPANPDTSISANPAGGVQNFLEQMSL